MGTAAYCDWFPLAVLLGLGTLLLTGCGPTPEAATTTPTNPVDPAVVREILDWFVNNRNQNRILDWRRGAERDRRFAAHRGFFISRRAWWLLGFGPAAWGVEPGHGAVIARLDNEFTQVLAFERAQLNEPGRPGPLTGAPDPVLPNHLDLADSARRSPRDPATTIAQALAQRSTQVQRRAVEYLTERRSRAVAIIWRAAAIHEDLWQPAADQRTATLRTQALAEVLDRRLHAVEVMAYHISRADALGAGAIDMSAGPTGPWRDGTRIRMFEYPRQPAAYAAFVGPIADHQDQPPGRRWRWESALRRRFVYNIFPGTRVRVAAEPAFAPIREPGPFDGYRRELLRNPPGLTPARAIDALFTPSADVWDRSWLYCDHVISGLHIKGLLHGQRRRNSNSDAPFNNLVTSNAAGFVRLSPVLYASAGASAPGPLMMGEPDPAFHNRLIGPADFQIGDHVIFWNSILYPIVATGEWQLENALVVELASDPERLSINLASLKMQGHGTVALTIGQYEVAIGRHLREGINDARNAAAAAPAGVDVLPFHGRPAVLVRWSPFGDPWSPPGPWWVRVIVPAGQTHAVLRERLRGGVIPDGTHPVAPPFNDCVYYPLYRPQFQNGWDGYIAARRGGPVRVSRRLAPVPVDGSMIPGLHYVGGAWHSLPVVRPKPIVP